jgi:hypothetical protein
MRILACSFLVASACGQVQTPATDAGSEPDGAVGPAALVATSPADGARTVEVTTAIELDLDGPIDPASIDGAITVHERDSARTVPIAHRAWDPDGHRVIVTLGRPLEYGATYRVEVSGLGVEVPAFRFTTRIASERRRIGGGWRRETTLDAAGWPARQDAYTAGADGVFETPDDVLTSHLDSTYDDGLLTSFRSLTADGTESYVVENEYGDAGLSLSTWRLSGAVALWQRDDYDAEDRLHRSQTYRDAGPDGVWLTDDDGAAEHQDYAYTGGQTLQSMYSDPGADRIWNTPDDPAPQAYVTTFDDGGRLTRRVLLGGQGAVVSYSDYTYDAATGLLTRITGRSTAGADAEWFTPDDRISGYDLFAYDGAIRTARQIFWCGADQLCDTPDDTLYERTTYDASL